VEKDVQNKLDTQQAHSSRSFMHGAIYKYIAQVLWRGMLFMYRLGKTASLHLFVCVCAFFFLVCEEDFGSDNDQ
jgi:hypothetical protein